jgi:hypothetical protein
MKYVLTVVLIILPCFAHGQTLGTALNATNLTWTTSGTGGSFGWSAESTTTHDGVSAATGGRINSFQTSTLQTTVTGPGTLSFWWMNPSGGNYLYLNIANSNVTFLVSFPSWQQQTIYLGPGSQTIKWVYSYGGPFQDTFQGYLDQVSYTAGATAPTITVQPPSQSQVKGLNANFRVTAGGTPPLHYQWRFNGTEIPGATNSSCVISNIQAANLGDYTVEITNTVGTLISSNATLAFGEVTVLGSPAFNDDLVPIGATNILAVAGGDYFSLALRADRALLGWGNNSNGQLNFPADLTNAISIAAGITHSIALKGDGTLVAWGDNSQGETNVPGNLTNVVAIAAAGFHNLALKSDGTVVAWGLNQEGQTNVPSNVTNVVAIACGLYSGLAVKADGTVALWGSNPGPPANLTNVLSAKGGGGHDVALLGDGTVLPWGQNTYGELNVPSNLSNVVAISSGDFDSLALLANGTVVGWGLNTFGLTTIPSGLTNVQAIASGDNHNLAVVGAGPPVIAASVTNAILSANGFSLSVPSQSGRVYVLQYKDSLTDSNWLSLPLVAGTGADLTLADTNSSSSQRYYRVLRW